MSKITELSDADFSALVKGSLTYTEILLSLGLSPRGGTSSKALKKRIQELGISVDHFIVRGKWSTTKHQLVIGVIGSMWEGL